MSFPPPPEPVSDRRTPADEEGEQSSSAAPVALVVDDEEGIRSFLARTLQRRGWRVETAGSAEEAAAILAEHYADVIVLDVALPGQSGLEWLKQLDEAGFPGEVVLMTAFADMQTAIDALRAGAADFILKPFRAEQMVNAINRCMERARLTRENYVLRRQLAKRRGVADAIIGTSPAMERLRQLIGRVAPTPTTVLIQGESGVGKELIARALHEQSRRADAPFVALNCAAIAPELVEAELFGHVRGAFTGAREGRKGLFYYAHGGTLFLDEVGELPAALQSKLLRVLEERRVRPVGAEHELPVDVRVIAATNRDLKAAATNGRFRQDLYFRLAVMPLTAPPLRERGDDVLELARLFLGGLAQRLGVPPLPLTDATQAALRRYSWPGNVRELRNFIERALLFGEFPLEDLTGGDGDDDPAPQITATAGDTTLSLAAVEKRHILAVLENCGGSKARAADLLGVSRKTLDRKCADWGL